MELLKKTIRCGEKKKEDNSDKKELLSKDRHPQSAAIYREKWFFIEDKSALENISYQLQYLEYMVNIYNDYQMYLTVESLHCKNMLITIASIMECALFDLLYQLSRKRNDVGVDIREDFVSLIDLGFRYGILNGSMKYRLHELRKVRNFVHISSLEHREYQAYTIDQVNNYLMLINEFQGRIEQNYKKIMK